MDCHPDTISYNSLLESCSNSFGDALTKTKSFQIALQAFRVLLANAGKTGNSNRDALVTPTSTTFTFFAKSCRRLLPTNDKKKLALTKTLQICLELGMLNYMVVRQFQTACQSEAEWKETVGELGKYMQWKDDFRKCPDVPNKWTCHSRR